MNDGYYDPHPARVPSVPICLIGFLGADQESIGSSLGCLTGLSFAHVPHLVAHRVGASVPRFVAERGVEAYRALERECTETAPADRPAGIVSLSDGALLLPRSRRDVLAGCG